MSNGKKYNSIVDCVVDARDGVDGAFESLYSMSYPYAYSAASHLLKNKEDIEDALQNSFYYVSKNIPGLREPAAYLKWLNRIVINECKKIMLEQGKHSKIFFAEKNRLMMSEDTQIIDSDLTEKSDLVDTVNKMIDEMNPKKSEVLKLYYFENLSYSQISDKLGIPVGTVMSRLYHAKRELEKKVKELQKDGTVLWSLPVIPLVAALLSYNVKADIPAAVIGESIGSAGAATAATAATASGSIGAAGTAATAATAGATGAGTAAAAVGTSVAVKAAAVAVAATVAVGGGVAAKKISGNRPPVSTTAVTESEYMYDDVNFTTRPAYFAEPAGTTSETQTSDPKSVTAAGQSDSTSNANDESASERRRNKTESTESVGTSEPVTTSNSLTEKEDEPGSENAASPTGPTTSVSDADASSVTQRNDQTETTGTSTTAANKTTGTTTIRETSSRESTTKKQTTAPPTTTAAKTTTAVTTTAAAKETSGRDTTTKKETTKAVTTTAAGTTAGTTTSRETTTKRETTTRSETTTKKETTTTKKETTTAVEPATSASAASFSASGGVISGYSGNGGAVTIPSTVNGEKVTAIGARAFEGSDITSVSIPSGVTRIGQMSFSDCRNLTSVSLPSTLESIGDCAFDGCSSLETITIPASVTSIGDDAFDGCDNLTIRCYEGSAAHDYAVDNSIDYELI